MPSPLEKQKQTNPVNRIVEGKNKQLMSKKCTGCESYVVALVGTMLYVSPPNVFLL